MRLTPRGRRVVSVVLFAVVLTLAYIVATVPALWWTDNPIPIR